MFLSTVLTASFLLAAPADDIAINLEWAGEVFSVNTDSEPSGQVFIEHEDGPGDTKPRRCAAGGPIRLGETTYEHGIGVNSLSVIRVVLPQPGKLFLADIGLDRNVDNSAASVRFHVEADGRTLFETDVIRPGSSPSSIEVPLEKTREFALVVDNGGDNRFFDQGDWADARVVLEDGSTRYLDELEWDSNPATAWPFSFIYGGRSSSALLPSWEQRVEVDSVEGGQRRSLILTDPDTELEVRAEVTAFTDSPGVDWIIHFTNRGESDTPVLEQVHALDAAFPGTPGTEVIFHSLRSTGGVDDWLPFSEALRQGQQRSFAPEAGRSSKGACPFFNVQWHGGGAVAGIGWTGQWAASVENRNGAIVMKAGMQHLHTVLHPGESIRTPRILFMRWSGGDPEYAYNQWRGTMLRHIVPKINGRAITPPIAHLSTAFYEMDQCTEALALDHLNAGKDLGFECYWYDAYYGRDNFPVVGNYVLPVERGFNTSRFPKQLIPLSEAAHKAGMQFLMWFEPERICPGTLMATDHPEWVVLPDDGGWGMFNLAIPEARQYITDYINSMTESCHLDWVRIDNAVAYTPLWRKLDAAAGPDRIGMAEIRYVEGLYRWWDDMRAAHPETAIDNCASGGGRIDLELCARSIPLWRTDATIMPLLNRDFHQAALQNQVMNAGLSRFVPFSASGQMGCDPYNFRSGFNAGISFCEDTRPEGYPREQLRAAIAEGKRIRKYYSGNLYALSDITTDPGDWCVLQYHRPEENDGMAMAFRRHASPYTGFSCEMRETDPAGEYEVTLSYGCTPEPPRIMNGADLSSIELNIDSVPGSLILEYRLRR